MKFIALASALAMVATSVSAFCVIVRGNNFRGFDSSKNDLLSHSPPETYMKVFIDDVLIEDYMKGRQWWKTRGGNRLNPAFRYCGHLLGHYQTIRFELWDHDTDGDYQYDSNPDDFMCTTGDVSINSLEVGQQVNFECKFNPHFEGRRFLPGDGPRASAYFEVEDLTIIT